MLFTSGTTGQPKGVVLSYDNAHLDRARPAPSSTGCSEGDEVLAYLPMAWVGQNIFSYAQWLSCGFVVNCPESAATVMIDLREIGPTYYFAPPRVFENLLTQVMIRMEDAGALKRWLFQLLHGAGARASGRRCSTASRSALVDRLLYRARRPAGLRPAANTLGL